MSATDDLGAVVAGLRSWGARLLPDPARAEVLDHALRDLVARKGTRTPVDRALLDQVEGVCHRTARHLTLEWHDLPSDPDVEPPGWPPTPADEVRARAGGVRAVRRLAAGLGELRLDGFDEQDDAGPYLRAAFTLLTGIDGLVLDLRHHGGGAVSSLALVAGWVLGGEEGPLLTVHHRDRPPAAWLTPPLREPLDRQVPVAVLVGPQTYSSGEALGYALQVRGRVQVFGEATPGAADHVTPIRLTPHVSALVPEGTPVDAVTDSNWEGRGVPVDVCCPAHAARERAISWLRKASSGAGTD